ncbi:MAG: TolC family protein [Spirochaetales bacterium]|nr:TolC family protein [Spirochaetales bacterium]
MKKYFIISFIILFPIVCSGAENLSMNLDSAMKTAEESSPQLLKAELALDSARRTHVNSWNTFLPRISLSGTFSGADNLITESSSSFSPWSISGGLSMSLQLSPAAAFSLEADRLAYEIELLNYQQTRTDLLANVEKAYYALLTQKSNLAIEESNLELAQKRWKQAKTNFAYGLASELSVLQAEVSAANLKPAYNQLVQNYESSKTNFLVLLGLDPGSRISLDESLPEFPPDIFLNTAYLVGKNVPNRIDVRSLHLRAAVLENSKNLSASSGRAPSLGLSAGYTDTLSNVFGTGDTIFTDRASVSLSLSVPIDVWIPGSSTDIAIQNFDDSIRQLNISISQLTESAEIEVLDLVSNIYTLQETIELSKLSLQLARRSYEMTEESFSRGRIERLNVEDAQQSLRRAEQQLLLSRSNLILSLIDLRLALNIESTEYLLENN